MKKKIENKEAVAPIRRLGFAKGIFGPIESSDFNAEMEIVDVKNKPKAESEKEGEK